MSDRRIFVFGHGYSAGHWLAGLDPSSVVGVTVREGHKAERLRARGLPAFLFDGDSKEPGQDREGLEAALRDATDLVVSIAPGHAAPEGARVGGANSVPGDPVLRHFSAAIEAMPRLAWIGYLSTVGVYGDHGGRWVDEDTAPRPASGRSKARLAAEQGWGELSERLRVPLAVLRLSGIYGPGRNPIDTLRAGRAKRLVKPGQVFNRIHVEDIAGALELLSQRRARGIFNVTDDEPAAPQDVVLHAAELTGLAPPPETDFETAELTPMARSFYGENKRVSNARLKAQGYVFRAPTYREGLARLAGQSEPLDAR